MSQEYVRLLHRVVVGGNSTFSVQFNKAIAIHFIVCMQASTLTFLIHSEGSCQRDTLPLARRHLDRYAGELHGVGLDSAWRRH
jgi:hypothetical protein